MVPSFVAISIGTMLGTLGVVAAVGAAAGAVVTYKVMRRFQGNRSQE